MYICSVAEHRVVILLSWITRRGVKESMSNLLSIFLGLCSRGFLQSMGSTCRSIRTIHRELATSVLHGVHRKPFPGTVPEPFSFRTVSSAQGYAFGHVDRSVLFDAPAESSKVLPSVLSRFQAFTERSRRP